MLFYGARRALEIRQADRIALDLTNWTARELVERARAKRARRDFETLRVRCLLSSMLVLMPSAKGYAPQGSEAVMRVYSTAYGQCSTALRQHCIAERSVAHRLDNHRPALRRSPSASGSRADRLVHCYLISPQRHPIACEATMMHLLSPLGSSARSELVSAWRMRARSVDREVVNTIANVGSCSANAPRSPRPSTDRKVTRLLNEFSNSKNILGNEVGAIG